MPEKSDENLRSIFSEKLSRIERSADDLQWEDLKSHIPSNRPMKMYWRLAVAAGVLLVILSLSFLFIEGSEAPQDIAANSNVEQQIQDPQPDNPVKKTDAGQTSSEVVEQTGKDSNQNPEKQVEKKEAKKQNLSPPIKEFVDISVVESISDHFATNLSTDDRDVDIPRQNIATADFGRIGNLTFNQDIVERKTSPVFSNLSLGVSPFLKFNRIAPSVNDYFFVEEVNIPSGLSTERLGAHFFASADVRLTGKSYISFGFSYFLQNYNLSYRYTDLVLQETSSAFLNELDQSLGGHLGLKRMIKKNGPREAYITVSSEYQKNLRNAGDKLVLSAGYEIRHQFNHTYSLSLQPTISYAFSGVRYQMFNIKPYWIGIRFSVNRTFLK